MGRDLTTLDLDQVASFLAVARLRTFRAAARERGLSQGAVSQQIAKLEGRLGARLIDRDPLGCRPTVEGRLFLTYAECLLNLNFRAVDALRGRRITVGASTNIGVYSLRPYLKTYLKEHDRDGYSLDIQIHQNPVIAQKLTVGEIDVAAMEWWDGRPGFEARLWRREALVVIVAPDHEWARLPRLPRTLLKGIPLLGGEPGTGTGMALSRYFGGEASELGASVNLGSTDAVKQWVKAGLGVSLVLPSTVAEEVRSGTLAAIPLDDGGPAKELHVIWRDSLAAEHPARKFGDWLVSRETQSC